MSKVEPGTMRTAYRWYAISLASWLYVACPVSSTPFATRSHRSPPYSSRSFSETSPFSLTYEAPISTKPDCAKKSRAPYTELPPLTLSTMEYSTGTPP